MAYIRLSVDPRLGTYDLHERGVSTMRPLPVRPAGEECATDAYLREIIGRLLTDYPSEFV